MIYSQIPLKCRLIPVNTDDEVFQTIFLSYFIIYLERASTYFMKIVNQEDEFEYDNRNEGEILFWAEWARDVHRQMEKIEETTNEFRWHVDQECAKKKKIWNDVRPRNLGFDYNDMSPLNVNFGITLWNECLDKVDY